jgi:MHS family proline/betaine transporter-like MFS transporter
MPLLKALGKYPKELLLGVGFSVLWVVSVYTLIIFMPTYEQKTLHFSSFEAFVASLIANVFMFVGCLLSGFYSDKIGRQKMLFVSTGLLFVGVYPMLLLIQNVHTFLMLIVTQTVFCILVSLFVGVAPSALSEIFPTEVRSTGISLTYNLPNAILGGFAPAILTLFTEVFHNTFAPAWYVMICAAITFIAILFMPAYRKAFVTVDSHAY